jgi:hypothetical protein
MTDHTFGGLGGIIDQITRRKFVMYNYNTIYTANLIDNRVVFDQPQQFNIGTLRCPTLIGNNLCGFRPFHDRNDAGIPLSKFYKLNLATLENKTYDVPFAPSGRFMPNFNPVCFKFVFSLLTHFRDTFIVRLGTRCMRRLVALPYVAVF